MDNKLETSPLPWRDNGNEIEDANGMVIGGALIDADAKLMAAAPKLLAALQGMVDAWNMVCDANGWERDHIQQQKDAVAAINKATGSAP